MNKNEFGQPLGLPVGNWIPRKKPEAIEHLGTYCRLEPLDLTRHTDPLFQALQGEEPNKIFTYLPYGPFTTVDSFCDWLAEDSLHEIYFVIVDLKTDTPQGMANFREIDETHGTIEVGSVLFSKNLQKTPAATEAMYLMMREVFDQLKYRRYQWRCNVLNTASRKAAERLGFTFEGIFRQHYVVKGHNRDTAWYSILDTEWPMLKERFKKWLLPENFDLNGQQKKKLNAF